MLRTKKVSVVSSRMKILMDRKKQKLQKAREEDLKEQTRKMQEKEKEQVLKYQELKKMLKECIYETPGMVIISEEENYMLVAKSTQISVNIIKNSNLFQPYRKESEEYFCIISLIYFGRRQKRSELYDELADVAGCRVHRVSHIDDIEFVLKKLDEIET